MNIKLTVSTKLRLMCVLGKFARDTSTMFYKLHVEPRRS